MRDGSLGTPHTQRCAAMVRCLAAVEEDEQVLGGQATVGTSSQDHFVSAVLREKLRELLENDRSRLGFYLLLWTRTQCARRPVRPLPPTYVSLLTPAHTISTLDDTATDVKATAAVDDGATSRGG